MASKRQVWSLTQDLICPICLDFFIDPVSLECEHIFCRSCVSQYWANAGRNSCPECKEVLADHTLKVNRALARLAERARKLSLNPREKESKLNCEEHEEELKLFCETDKKLICVICAAAWEHREHRFRTIKEAVDVYKAQMKSLMASLTKSISAIQEKEQLQKQKISGLKEQSYLLQSHFRTEFSKMHQILAEREQRLLRELREEEKRILNRMEENLRVIQEDLISAQRKLSNYQKKLQQEGAVVFLQGEAIQDESISNKEYKLDAEDEVLQVGRFDHPLLLKTALREVLDAINPVSITLDVETAHPALEVSEDRKSVRWTGIRRNVPDTAKRFTVWPCVLGSEVFTSGRHYWEVEVEGNWGWSVGVAAEFVERKAGVGQRPETGVWVIERSGDEFYANARHPSLLASDPAPGRVGVYLNYDLGTVSFYNPETKSHLYTFGVNNFGGKFYPFIGTWDENQSLRICRNSALDLPKCQARKPAAGAGSRPGSRVVPNHWQIQRPKPQ
ncbi:zinc-binding protein A33-like [Mobula hypostoma]|uniref:zinc-binding protein A33-like n=1 Tax=Mobula hypostoma TaxID=723540 RepID=UPI002FC38333